MINFLFFFQLFFLILIIISLMIDNMLYLKRRKRRGKERYYRLSEHILGQKEEIITDRTYSRYDLIEGTIMENRKIDFSFNEDGLRFPPFECDNAVYRFFFLGDSVVESAIVEAKKTFPYRVGEIMTEKGYATSSYNAGYSGANFYRMNQVLLMKILPLNPSHVFICCGVHEIYGVLGDEDIYKYVRKRNVFFRNRDVSKVKALQMFFPEISASLIRMFSFLNKSNADKIETSDISRIKEKIEKYVPANAALFCHMCLDNNVVPVVLLQTTRLSQDINKLTERDYKLYYNDFARTNGEISISLFKELLEYVNMLIANSIEQIEGARIVYMEDIESVEEAYVYDLLHLTEQGSEMVAQGLCELLQSHIL